MVFRALISTALGKAQCYSADIIVALCRATEENNNDYRLEYLTEARDDARKILQAIEDALAVEQREEAA